jgi:hypothetical protein
MKIIRTLTYRLTGLRKFPFVDQEYRLVEKTNARGKTRVSLLADGGNMSLWTCDSMQEAQSELRDFFRLLIENEIEERKEAVMEAQQKLDAHRSGHIDQYLIAECREKQN